MNAANCEKAAVARGAAWGGIKNNKKYAGGQCVKHNNGFYFWNEHNNGKKCDWNRSNGCLCMNNKC